MNTEEEVGVMEAIKSIAKNLGETIWQDNCYQKFQRSIKILLLDEIQDLV